MARGPLRKLGIAAVAGSSATVLLGLALFVGLNHWPAEREQVPVEGAPDLPALKRGEPFTVLSWNLQYGAPRSYHFFYDGGPSVHVPAEDVLSTMDAIAALIGREDPALLLLQEVDRGSDRTARIDELAHLRATLPPHQAASATYHRSRFVPTPGHQMMGKVDMNLALASRHGLAQAERIQLPLLDEPVWRQAFNLKRALLVAEVPVDGSAHPLAIAVTHLSAFSYGDGTLDKQVAVLEQWMASRPAGQPWILAGDFNLLPPGDDPARLAQESDAYADETNPVERLIPRFREVFGEALLAPGNRTYLPFGAAQPDRKIDYLFVGGPIEVEEARVVAGEALQISDHLPIVARLRITP